MPDAVSDTTAPGQPGPYDGMTTEERAELVAFFKRLRQEKGRMYVLQEDWEDLPGWFRIRIAKWVEGHARFSGEEAGKP